MSRHSPARVPSTAEPTSSPVQTGLGRRLLAACLLAVASTVVGLPGVASPADVRPLEFDLSRPDAVGDFTPEKGSGFDGGTRPLGDAPFYFSVALPEGNWRVTLTLGGADATSDTTVKAESRRLMFEGVRTAHGAMVTRSFVVNVRNRALTPPEKNAPGGNSVLTNDREEGSFTWDDKLTLEFTGSAPRVSSLRLEPASVPTLFLLGDSTVTDQRFEDSASWGQMLPRFLGPGIAVANHAESGETLKSFVSGLRLAKVLEQLEAEDWVFIQFAHNDQKKQWPQTYVDASTTYTAWLRAVIAEVRLRGAHAVLVTSPQRRTFGPDGRIQNTLGDYPDAMRRLAAAENLPLIDLEAASRTLYESLGRARAPLAFSNGGKDGTHHNNYGAYQLARAVVEGLRSAHLPLAGLIVPDVSPFDPAHPPAPESFVLAPSPARSSLRPRGN